MDTQVNYVLARIVTSLAQDLADKAGCREGDSLWSYTDGASVSQEYQTLAEAKNAAMATAHLDLCMPCIDVYESGEENGCWELNGGDWVWESA